MYSIFFFRYYGQNESKKDIIERKKVGSTYPYWLEFKNNALSLQMDNGTNVIGYVFFFLLFFPFFLVFSQMLE